MSLKPRQTHQIIVIQRPNLWVFSMFLLFCLVLSAIWAAYEYGRYFADNNNPELQAYIIQLESQLDAARVEIVETQRQASMLERNRQIDDDASLQLKETLVAAQNEVLSLKKELTFYKSIVSPEQGERSLNIQMVELKPELNGEYHYKVMVSQRGRNDKFARGTIDISVEGQKAGKPVTLKLSEVSNEKKKAIKFGFKYFQIFEGVMSMPEAFQPEQLRVSVKPKTAKIKPVNKQYSWSDLTTGGA